MSVVSALARFTRPTRRTAEPTNRADGAAACGLCNQPIGPAHSHVVDLDARALCCACRACAILFEQPGAAQGRWRTVPSRYQSWQATEAEDEALAALQLPVGLAFFFFNSKQNRWVAHYPSPAGPTESELPLDAWTALSRANPLLAAAAPDVEGILVHPVRTAPHGEWFLVPIDACYELVGILRTTWKGFDGGDEAKARLGAFFESIRQRSRPLARPETGGF